MNRIFFVNQYARDDSKTRELTDDEHRAKPWRCFTYITAADSPAAAIELVKRDYEIIARSRSYPAWAEVFYRVQNEDGQPLQEPVYNGCGDITQEEVDRIRLMMNERTKP